MSYLRPPSNACLLAWLDRADVEGASFRSDRHEHILEGLEKRGGPEKAYMNEGVINARNPSTAAYHRGRTLEPQGLSSLTKSWLKVRSLTIMSGGSQEVLE